MDDLDKMDELDESDSVRGSGFSLENLTKKGAKAATPHKLLIYKAISCCLVKFCCGEGRNKPNNAF